MELRYLHLLSFLLWIFVNEQIHISYAIEGSEECMPLPYEKVKWVRPDGTLYENLDNSLDLSLQSDALDRLRTYLEDNVLPLKILSLAQCELVEVPSIFTLNWNNLTNLGVTLERVSFYGNNFNFTAEQTTISTKDIINDTIPEEYMRWPLGFEEITLPNLLELDLRKCSIYVLPSQVFRRMPSLQRLDLSGNHIYYSAHEAFAGLSNLYHLDITENSVFEMRKRMIVQIAGMTLSDKTFEPLISLKTLDLSYSRFSPQTSKSIFKYIASSLKMLSLCSTRTPDLPITALANTDIQYLDFSSNLEISDSGKFHTFSGIEDTLEVLLVKKTGLSNINPFLNLTKLKILSLADNNLQLPTRKDMEKLSELVILDLGGNRISNWNFEVFREHKKLRYLSLLQNNINLISENLLHDIQHINLVGLRGNSFVCNCLLRNLIEYSTKRKKTSTYYTVLTRIADTNTTVNDPRQSSILSDSYTNDTYSGWNYTLFSQYFSGSFLTLSELELLYILNNEPNKTFRNYTFQLFDYTNSGYRCIESDTVGWQSYQTVEACSVTERAEDYDQILERGQYYMYVIIAVSCSLLPLIGLLIWKWWYVRYFLILLKNTALLSVLDMKKNDIESDTIYNYDAFVSYCNEDRDWIVEELLPHIEQKENVKICLHERDFEVGVSILENIVSCMDRSRAIVLIISQQFLLSHWCQFEMHLAQHRLIETKREHLILILLEDIPRRKRPNTLHYLMMTKTYIVWPRKAKDKNIETQLFWKRLRKALMEGKPGTETDSRV